MRERLRTGAVDVAGRVLLDPLLSTVRFQVRGRERVDALAERGEGWIYVLWHGRLLPLTFYHRQRNIVSLISQSRDGEHIARVVERWGYEVIRGSSSRGGSEALRQLVRRARSGRVLAFTPDGPRGPRQKMKPGALLTARMAGTALVPLAAGCDRAWWFEGWDRFLVPRPFATVRVAYGEPCRVPADADEAELERRASLLEAELNRLTEEVDAGVGFA